MMIKSVEKAIKILEFVSEHRGEPVPLKQISNSLDMHIATCSHLVETLCSLKYLEKRSRSKGVIIGPATYALATPSIYRKSLLRMAVPKMKELCATIRENVVISTYLNGAMYVPYSIYYSDGHIRSKTTVKGKLFDSASGPLILAFLNPLERAETINSLPEDDETRKKYIERHNEFEVLFQRIRKTGVSVVENVDDIYGAASCPIFGKNGLVAALGVNMPRERFHGEHLEYTLEQMKQTAYEISRLLYEGR